MSSAGSHPSLPPLLPVRFGRALGLLTLLPLAAGMVLYAILALAGDSIVRSIPIISPEDASKRLTQGFSLSLWLVSLSMLLVSVALTRWRFDARLRNVLASLLHRFGLPHSRSGSRLVRFFIGLAWLSLLMTIGSIALYILLPLVGNLMGWLSIDGISKDAARVIALVVSLSRWLISLGLLLLGIGGLALMFDTRWRHAWPEIGIPALACFALALVMLPQISFARPDRRPQLQLKAENLASGPIRVLPNEYVTLMLVPKNEADGEEPDEPTSYYNLQVLDLLGEDGRSVVFTGESPGSILLAVPQEDLSPILAALQSEQAVYLLPQGAATVTPTSTPTPTLSTTATVTPTNTLPPGSVPFDLPAAKIRSNLDGLAPGKIVVILVEERKASEGNVVSYEAGRYDAELLDVFDGNGVPTRAYKNAAIVRIGLRRGDEDAAVREFVRQLAGVSAIYILPVQTAATPPSTAMPTPPPAPTTSPAPAPQATPQPTP